jgi:nucleoside-diphosphate-sugar epimerase
MSKKTILVFGGNGFIGAEVVEYILDHNCADYEIVLVNRGNWDDWDTATRIRPRVKETLICDRKHHSFKLKLKSYLDQEDFQFEAVIDFSAFKSCVITNALRDIPVEKIKQYILISTDSVYEVSEYEPGEKINGEYYSKESDSKRPASQSERLRLKEFDSYGHHKFK